jgi:Ca2+-transporting ATPase
MENELPHAIELDKLIENLSTTPSGLPLHESKRRLEEFGRNFFPSSPPKTIGSIFFHQFLDPLIYVLAFAGVVAISLGDYTDAFFILLVLVINAVIGTIQEYGAEKSALALKQMSATKAVVIREGESFEIDAEELVPGDIISLESGNKIPADIRLISVQSLEVDESLLTGESMAVTKDAKIMPEKEASLGDRKNMAYSGSIVIKGRGRGVVVGTGFSTELGKIAEAITFSESAKPPLIIRMEIFTKKLTFYFILVTIAMALYLFYQGQGWHDILMFSVALAVSAIPEGLPVALTIALAVASRKMAKRNVIVRKLPAVESLGSCTFIATDKTGTLTVNQLTVKKIAFPNQEPLIVSGTGLNPEGRIHFPKDESQLRESLHHLLRGGVLCNEAQLYRKNDSWKGSGDAVDLAFLVLSHKAGQHPDDFQQNYKMIQEIPYEPENKYAASLHESKEAGKYIISVKGALEKILTLCDVSNKDIIINQADSMAEEGLRVLALAGRDSSNGEKSLCDQLKGLHFHGLVGMLDPLRTDALAAVAACHNAGIQVAMVTGDHPKTALAIAKELGLANSHEQVITGPQLKESDEKNKGILIDGARVFARVEPKQKLDIVTYLINHSHFVAVTGDGANDAPALKKANVGIAMGKSGTDVAKETADLILTDDKFSSIVSGIEEGRIAYSNIRKVVSLLVTTGVAEILMFSLCLVMDTPLPLTAIQLLWLNLVTNSIQHIGISFEPGEGDELKKSPRHPDEPIFDRLMIERVFLSALVIGGVSFWQFQSFLKNGMELSDARNYTLLLMVLFENMMVGNCRSEEKSLFAMNPLNNPILLFGTIAAQLFHIACMYIPSVAEVVGLSPVQLMEWTRLLALSASVLLVMEFYKFIRFKKSH